MRWAEFRDFALVGTLVFNVCLIMLVGHTMNKNTARIKSLEIKQSGLASAVDVGILQLGRAVNDIKLETLRLRGIKTQEGGN